MISSQTPDVAILGLDFGTGNGHATKDDMLVAIRAAGHCPADDNEADAIGLARCGAQWWLENVENAAA